MGNVCIAPKYNYRRSLRERKQRENEIKKKILIDKFKLHNHSRIDWSLLEANLRNMGDDYGADEIHSYHDSINTHYFNL